ncbi:YdcF family protein [Phenylobacterium sp.]|uniref:YdcF family protein n=1 Tax=Phenylobacterium sp. TaxID=1871053 RepID=UPI002E302CF5|nr:YdcF family protein [Phenylobacterium sp.]HEX2559761.1 YdcF family protein [Phenylobacterium sp.]
MDIIVLLGAAVRPDGRPSAALARRIAAAAKAAEIHPTAMVFCSGGVGRHGPSEASVMARDLVRLGVAPARLVLDESSLDTLQTAIAAARYMRAERLTRCLVCTDSYHAPRALALMLALGMQGRMWPAKAGLRQMGPAAWAWMRAREAVAFPYDVALALMKRGRVLRS